jgi:nitrogen-specific signal transduction histidine kinase
VYKDDSGKPQRLIGVNMDITERRQAEERLRKAQKLESIGLLAGGIAHDFNNLLTVIIGNADFARTKYPSSEELQHIIAASERAAHLTSQLLAYAGKGQFISKIFSLKDVVSGSAELLSVSVPKSVELRFNLSHEELLIKGDPSQIDQILMNLVINASEAIPPEADGRIEITTSGEVIPETLIRNAQGYDVQPGRFVCLEVTDNGSGMDEATLAKIFDPFFSTKFTGRGLGLPAVQGIVRSCGGFIDVHSSPGAGSTFRVFLPASAEQPAAAVPVGARPGALRRRQDRRPATILIVDDEEMVRSMARTALRNEGHEVLEANNGKDALDVLAGAAMLPALVLLDLTMPVMGGAELVPILNHDYPGLRVIVTSGYSEEDVRKDLPPGVIAGFLQKPYTLSTLIEKVDVILNGGGPSEEVRKAA